MGERRMPGSKGRAVLPQVPLSDRAEEAPHSARVGERIVEASEPLPVLVWLRAKVSGEFRAEGHAIAWTDRQVHVRYLHRSGRHEGFAWVWANAVTRR
ncbi:hypothetical protein [Myceligenerans crystallogenes]|uniref:Uncharacterized protein n=1 Tax=Myceligenerans crystallogenes TaxID=316335 RepID=A0ABN2N7D8_9MICO